MRLILLCFTGLLAACSQQANHLGNPLLLPISGLGTALNNAAYAQRRGQVEVFVKTNHPQLITDILNGGGATLTQAMDIARIARGDRPTRLLQLDGDIGLYQANPGALVTALMVYGNEI